MCVSPSKRGPAVALVAVPLRHWLNKARGDQSIVQHRLRASEGLGNELSGVATGGNPAGGRRRASSGRSGLRCEAFSVMRGWTSRGFGARRNRRSTREFMNAFGCDLTGLAGCVSLLGSGRPLRPSHGRFVAGAGATYARSGRTFSRTGGCVPCALAGSNSLFCRGSTCCAKMWSTYAATEVILMAYRRRDKGPRESDCQLREVLLTSARNGHYLTATDDATDASLTGCKFPAVRTTFSQKPQLRSVFLWWVMLRRQTPALQPASASNLTP
jgi:hypothetical protein